MKHLPLLLLALMAALFFATPDSPAHWASWIHAFAEAGMVGALADWFAVTALFRHPMGIPVPHTAIIPSRKDEIGDSLARFVAEHFLDPTVVRARLEPVNLAAHAALWLKSPAGRGRLQDLGAAAARWILAALHEQRVRGFIARLGSRQLQRMNPAPLLGALLEGMVRDGRHQQLLTQSLRFALVALHDNREVIRGNVQRESPWWLPGFVDDRIVVKMLDRIETLLLEMSLDEEHSVRADFNRWIERWAGALRHGEDYAEWGQRLAEGWAENDALQDYVVQVWSDFAAALEQDLANPESGLHRELDRLLNSLADELDNDPRMQEWLNGWLVEATVALVENNRAGIASLIGDTVRTWDARETSQRVEQAIGRDLQFIRVNGTLVGGLVGLAIHAVNLL
ncbi:MAG: DUF445 domain-containing protein [Lysobacterales bacterium]|jgi:uncharacterized membrane-anchored protein YjiN (DUF445 family)